ncbi:unnamed protein product, partial [Sphenostylis stenocarpa]
VLHGSSQDRATNPNLRRQRAGIKHVFPTQLKPTALNRPTVGLEFRQHSQGREEPWLSRLRVSHTHSFT